MDLLVIRHAIAEDKEAFARTGRDDAQRPLTDDGRAKMERVAAGLGRLAPELARLATSPLLRARQTAEIVSAAYDEPPAIETTDVLSPDSEYDDFVRWLNGRDIDGTIAVVGHEPHLGGLLTWLLTGREESHTPLRKGGAALLSFDDAPGPGRAQLIWLLTPGILRRL